MDLSGHRIPGLGIFLLTVTAVLCQPQEATPTCKITDAALDCSNIINFSTVLDVLPTEDFRVVSLKINRSPRLDITKSDIVRPEFENLHLLHVVESGKTSVDSELFLGFSELKLLSLRANNITSIKANTLSGFPHLTTLNLADNQISTIDAGAFKVCENLTELDLNGNTLTTISPGLFEGLKILITLKLGENQLATIGKSSFHDLEKLKFLHLGKNNIKYIHQKAFQNLQHLKALELRGNLLEGLDSRMFADMSLITLDLSRNNLTNISNFPLNTSTLYALGLHECNISTIPLEYFQNLPNLRFLDLGKNNINYIEPGLMKHFPDLSHFSIIDNALKSMNVASFNQIYQILTRPVKISIYGVNRKIVRMSGNPWNCSTHDMQDLRTWTTDHNVEFDRIFDCNQTAAQK